MFGIGFQEMLIILVVVLIFFGPKRLPDLAKSLGKGIAEFKKASEEVRKGIEEAVKEEAVKEEAVKEEAVKEEAVKEEAVKEEAAGEGRKAPETPTTPADGTGAAPDRQEAAASAPAVTDTVPAESPTNAATPRPG